MAGPTYFGSTLLQPARSVCVSSERFLHGFFFTSDAQEAINFDSVSVFLYVCSVFVYNGLNVGCRSRSELAAALCRKSVENLEARSITTDLDRHAPIGKYSRAAHVLL